MVDEAQTEVDRRQVIRSVKRDIYEVKTYLSIGEINIGDTVTINYSGFGFESGKDMVVIGIRTNIGGEKTTLTVWG